MPELREALTHKVQQARGLVEKGKAKLVGTARPPKERKAYEIAAEPVTLGSEDEKLVITATGAAAVETKAAEMAEQEMQRKPGERLSLSSIARTVWKRSLGSEYFRERARLYSKELLATVNNNVFSDERIAQAKQRAEARYQQELRQANIAKKTGRRALEFAKSAIGKKTLMQQYTLEELASLTHATEEQTLVRELGQTHERFRKTLDQNDAMIRTEMGEQLHILQEATPQEKAIIDKGRKLMEDFASGALNEAQFQTESQGVWSMMKNLKPELLKAADLYTSSLFETAKALKTQRNQGVSMAVIQARIANSEFRIAFGVMGAATSIEASTTKKIVGRLEKTLNRFEKNPLGALILNEATVGGGVALGLSALLVPRSMATSAARLVAPIGGSLVGGAFGAVREYRRLGRERKVHIGEKEAGYPVSQGERRKWFEQFNVPQKNATELIDALKLPDKPTQDDLQRFMGTIADVQTRINISSRRENRLGLVTFSSPQMIETERTKLFLAMREARQKLDTVDPTLLQATTSNQTSQEFLRKAIEVRTTEINNEVEETTRRFNRARTGKAIKYGAIAAGAGMVAGEAVADVSHLTATGHVEAVGPIGQVVTALGGGVPAQTAVEELASRTQTIEPQAAGVWQTFATADVPVPGVATMGDHVLKLTIPEGTHLTLNPKSAYDLVFDADASRHADTTVLHDLKFDQTGKFIKPDDWQQQLDALSQKNFNLTVDEHALSPIEVEPGVSGTFDKAVGDMGATHGARGPWGWLEEPMQDPTSGISHQVPATNLTKNLFRGWEENVQGHHVDYTTLSNKFIFKDLPNGLFGDDALPRIGHVMDEAIKLREVDNIPLNTMDELHRLAYEIGRVGRVPTADEVNRFMELLGGGEKVTPFETIVKLQELIPAVPPVEVTPPVEQLAVPPVEVTAPPIPVGWHRPLEEFVATTVPQAAPTAPLEAGITQKITPPAPADKTQPMKPVPPTPAEEETQPSKTTLESLAETQPIRPIATPAPTAPPTPPPAAAPAAPPGPILEASSIFPKQNDYEKLIKDQAPNILKKIRWQLNYMDRTSTQESRPFNPEQALDGLIRSNLAEQLSTILSIPDCPTVFSSGEDSSHLSPTTFTAALGEDTERLSKEQILAQVVRKSIEETPLSNIKKLLQKKYPNEEKRQKAYDQLVEEIVAGYSSTGSGTNAGILYAESVIPDGVLQNAQGEIIGFSEVKTYRPDELDSLKQKLSDQISGEITFIDNLRTVGFGMPALGDDMPMLLRFPSDIPDESLKSLGQDLQKLGFSRVLIQKLPLNSTQLSEISKELVRSNLKQIRRGTIEFSQEGIELLEKYSKPPETLATTIAAPKPVTEKTQPMKPVPPTPAEEETQPSKTTLESLAETQPIRPIATSATRPITPTPPVSPEPIPAPQPEPAITETQPIQVAVAPEKPSPATKPAPKEEVSETGIPQKVEAPPPSAVPLPAAEALQETQKIKPVAPPVSPPEAPQTPTATPMVQAAPAPILTEAPAPEAMPTGDVRTRMRDALNQADQAKTDTTTMQLSPDDFLEFAKSMTLPYGTTIMGGNIRIRGNELIIDNVVLNIPTKGEAKVNARYRADEKGLIMDQYKAHLDGLNLNFLEKGLVPGIIQNTMKALELKLKEVINQAIGLPWNATLIGISGNNLTVMFQKRRK